MKSIKANVCVEFLKDVIYTTKSGELVSFDGEDFYYGTGKKADMDHLIFLPLIDNSRERAFKKCTNKGIRKGVVMSDVAVDVKALFMEDVEYVLSTGIIVKYEDGYLVDRNGNRVSTDDYPVLPMINYHPQVKAGPAPKEKEVWQFEDGEQPKLLSNNYVVETENFKRVGSCVYVKGGSVSFPVYYLSSAILEDDEFNMIAIISIDHVGVEASKRRIAVGTVEELLQVLA